MNKKILLFVIISFISISSLSSTNKKIHIEGYVPPKTTTIQIDYEEAQITINNNLAYFKFTNVHGKESNIHNSYYLKVYMI